MHSTSCCQSQSCVAFLLQLNIVGHRRPRVLLCSAHCAVHLDAGGLITLPFPVLQFSAESLPAWVESTCNYVVAAGRNCSAVFSQAVMPCACRKQDDCLLQTGSDGSLDHAQILNAYPSDAAQEHFDLLPSRRMKQTGCMGRAECRSAQTQEA